VSGPGRFTTLKVGEGARKSTQAARLAESLRLQGPSVLVTREPGGSSPAVKRQKLSPAEFA